MSKPARTFMLPEALGARLQHLQSLVPLVEAGALCSALTVTEIALPMLTANAEHGNITGVKPAERNGRKLVAVSIQGRNPRLLMPLDYVALDLVTGFGLHLTIQKTTGDETKRRDYPRITSPGPNGWVFQVLRILADAQPGQVVKQNAVDAHAMDHHYLGRDALTVTSDDAERAAGKQLRHTTRGRTDLIAAAKDCFEANRAKFDLPDGFDAEHYGQLLALSFALADWVHGRLDGQLLALMQSRDMAEAVV